MLVMNVLGVVVGGDVNPCSCSSDEGSPAVCRLRGDALLPFSFTFPLEVRASEAVFAKEGLP